MTKPKDRKLMLDLMKYPAEVFFRDDFITVLKTKDLNAYLYFSEGNSPSGSDDYIIRTYKDEIFIIRHMPKTLYGEIEKIEFHASNNHQQDSLRRRGLWETMTRKYPSLFDAFGELAKRVHFLPLIKDQSDADIYEAIKKDKSAVCDVRNLTFKRKKVLLSEFPDTFRYMDQDKELVEYAIENILTSLRDVNRELRTNRIIEMALRKDPHNICYIDNPTENQKKYALSRNGQLLKYINNPTFEMQVLAVNQSPDAWECIKDPKVRRQIKKVKNQKKYKV